MAYGKIAAIGKVNMYRGSSSNQTVIQTDNNIIMLCGDVSGITCPSNGRIIDLPATITYPDSTVHFPCAYLEGSTYNVGVFYINTNGRIYSRNALNNATVFFNTTTFNFNSVFYSDAIGNNDESTMTSPISWR